MRPGIPASIALVLAACSSGTLGEPDSGANTSPGTVTLHLTLASTPSFCDPLQYNVCFDNHISVQTLAGQPLTVALAPCSLICSNQCVAPPCAAGVCITGGRVVTEATLIWDGSYYESSTCGQGAGCFIPRFVAPGRYVAHMCATPGMISDGDGGQPTCAATDQRECVDTPFDLPGPSPVEATLP